MPETGSWFEIKSADAASGATDIYLYGGIGSYGITAGDFLSAISGVKSKTINLHVNSPGGGVDDGIAIYNALKDHPAAVHGTVDGLAASIASVIMQACDKRMMGAGSMMMIHEPYIGLDASVRGNAGDMRQLATEATKTADYLDKLGENVAEIYATRGGGEAADWRSQMQAETWYRASEAVTAGLADSVIPAKGAKNAVQAFNLADFGCKNVPEWVNLALKPADPAPIAAVIVEPDPISAVQRMKIPAAMKRAAIAHLKAQQGRTAAA